MTLSRPTHQPVTHTRLNEFLEQEEPKIGKRGNEIPSNVTANESAKMPTSHGVIQGCTAQAWVDEKHQVIVHAQTGSSQDHNNLDPMRKGAKKNMQPIGKQFTADSNYYCLPNLALCQTEPLDAYIPDSSSSYGSRMAFIPEDDP